jgi:uncharacterized membrane protein YuzA (DUF378 family)
VRVVGRLVGALTSLHPVAYLVVVGLAGILFAAFALLYLPARSGR